MSSKIKLEKSPTSDLILLIDNNEQLEVNVEFLIIKTFYLRKTISIIGKLTNKQILHWSTTPLFAIFVK